jgi:hypothetical protein
MRPRLRLFTGSDEPETAILQEPDATIKLGELTRILSDAIIWDRTWVSDFADDDVRNPVPVLTHETQRLNIQTGRIQP